MANYYSSARSNYFLVKDEEAFKKWVKSFGDLSCHPGVGELFGQYCITVDSEDIGGWPDVSITFDELGHALEKEIDFYQELSEHLVQGQVAVLLEIGAEKLRYLVGLAVAVAWDGDTHLVSLNDIYDWVITNWGAVPSEASY